MLKFDTSKLSINCLHSVPDAYISKDLKNYEVINSGHQESWYAGPYKVLSDNNKCFNIITWCTKHCFNW